MLNEDPELLTAAEVALRLRLTPATIRSWGRRGRIPVIRAGRKSMRFAWSAVIAALVRCAACGVAIHETEVGGSDRAPVTARGRVWCRTCADRLDAERPVGGAS